MPSGRMRRPAFWSYVLPGLVLGMPTIPVYVHMPAFYAETLGLGLTVTGFVLFAARLFDTITDPAAGVLSDRLNGGWGRFGRRKPLILIGGLITGLGLVKLLSPDETVTRGYLFIWSITLYCGWTLIAVPYAAWGAELTRNADERAKLTGAREGAMLLGVLIAASLPAAAGFDQTGDGARATAEGMALIAWTAIGLGVPVLAALLTLTPDSPSTNRPPPPSLARARASLGQMARNKPFIRLLGAWFVNGLANGVPAVLFPLYLDHALLADAGEKSLLILAYFLAGVAAIPGWVALSARAGKHRVWCISMIIACAAFLAVPFLEPGAVIPFLIICLITGAALGADLALPPAMQADVVDYDTLRTKGRRAGSYFALWSMSTKLALAGSVAIAFPAIERLGFKSGENPLETQGVFALVLIYAGLPIVFKLVAVMVVWRHPLDVRRQRIIRRRLDRRERRQAAGPAGV